MLTLEIWYRVLIRPEHKGTRFAGYSAILRFGEKISEKNSWRRSERRDRLYRRFNRFNFKLTLR